MVVTTEQFSRETSRDLDIKSLEKHLSQYECIKIVSHRYEVNPLIIYNVLPESVTLGYQRQSGSNFIIKDPGFLLFFIGDEEKVCSVRSEIYDILGYEEKPNLDHHLLV